MKTEPKYGLDSYVEIRKDGERLGLIIYEISQGDGCKPSYWGRNASKHKNVRFEEAEVLLHEPELKLSFTGRGPHE